MIARKIASIDRTIWVESATRAFARFLSPSVFSLVNDAYRREGGIPDATPAEKDILMQSLLCTTWQMITRNAADLGIEVRVTESTPGSGTSFLTSRFPSSRTRAPYVLMLRVCNLEIAWVGLYLKTEDLDKAVADLENFTDRQQIDFDFPLAGGLPSYRDLLEFDLRRKGIILLNQPPAAEDLEAVTREYLEILSRIPGMVRQD